MRFKRTLHQVTSAAQHRRERRGSITVFFLFSNCSASAHAFGVQNIDHKSQSLFKMIRGRPPAKLLCKLHILEISVCICRDLLQLLIVVVQLQSHRGCRRKYELYHLRQLHCAQWLAQILHNVLELRDIQRAFVMNIENPKSLYQDLLCGWTHGVP